MIKSTGHIVLDMHKDDQKELENREREIVQQSSKRNGPTRQFYKFLAQHRLEGYFEAFRAQKCCDIRDVQYLDDEQMLKNMIGMNTVIERRRFIGECRKLKVGMDEFQSLDIPHSIRKKMDRMGIVTLNILRNEVVKKEDLTKRLGIVDDVEIDKIWRIMERGKHNCMGMSSDGRENSADNEQEGMEQEGVQNIRGNVIDTLHGYMMPMSVPNAPVSKSFDVGPASFAPRGKSTPYL